MENLTWQGRYGSIPGVPEMAIDEPYNTYAADVYCLDETLREIIHVVSIRPRFITCTDASDASRTPQWLFSSRS